MLAYLPSQRVAPLNSTNVVRTTGRVQSQTGFSIEARLTHFALLAWAVPVQRLTRLLPTGFQLEETWSQGGRVAWVSVASCVDEGVEQTSYRLHVRRNGEPAQWLLGLSLGALSAVAARNLWSMPWHLSAMELTRIGQTIQLRTQSQWANANWQIAARPETEGEIVHLETLSDLPPSLTRPAFNQYFQRRDGAIGWRRVKLLDPLFRPAKVNAATCDRLQRLGILDEAELVRPRLAVFQHELGAQMSASALLESPVALTRQRAA